jgi:preprotein translocase subunit SecY
VLRLGLIWVSDLIREVGVGNGVMLKVVVRLWEGGLETWRTRRNGGLGIARMVLWVSMWFIRSRVVFIRHLFACRLIVLFVLIIGLMP